MNATLRKFGYPESLVWQGDHWCVLLRPAQTTLGALVLGAQSDATAFSGLEPPAFAELQIAISGIEKTLAAFRRYDRINYLMLMMVDPHVHFHVLPRYDTVQTYAGIAFADLGWPGPPDLKSATDLSDDGRRLLLDDLRSRWMGA